MLKPSVQSFLIPATVYSGDNILTCQHNSNNTIKLVLLDHEKYSITTTTRSHFGTVVKTCDPLCCHWKAPVESISAFPIVFITQYFDLVDYIKIANEYIDFERAFPNTCAATLSDCICPSRVPLVLPDVNE